jgi:GT2 family glycosyltransferase
MLYVVIPVHNRKTVTCRCLAKMQEVLPPGVAVVVVDDGSTDGTSDAVREQFPWVHLLQGDGNLWWSGGVNAGIRYALAHSATAVMTMNDDTLPTERLFQGMLEQHRTNTRAVLGALEIDAESDEVFGAGDRMNWWTGQTTPLHAGKSASELNGLAPVTHLPGRSLLIPAEVFERIGLFDEKRLPQAVADYDFTHRARRAGFGVYCNYDAPLLMFPDMTAGRSLRRQRSWRAYWHNLFGIRGDANLKFFTVFALKNCPIICLPGFLAIGYAQRLFGYWLRRPIAPVSKGRKADVACCAAENR